jgi:glycosyltransferase involved in cell wall biosynthesis
VAEAIDPGAVVVAYVHNKDVTYSWHHSMIELIGHDLGNAQRVMRGGYISMKCASSDGLVESRNRAVKAFLAEKQADWLWWVDTDMGFTPDTIDRLLASADPETAPIVGGLCFTQREEAADGMGGYRTRATPTVFDWLQVDGTEQQGFSVRWDYPHDQLVPCAGTGSACVLIHRSVFERIQEQFGEVWYDRIPNPTMGKIVGEDLSFCLRALTLGIPVHVDTSVKTSHQKVLWLAEPDYFGQVALSQLTPRVPPATEATAVLVPVLGRPQNAKPFMQSLGDSGADLATVYAIADFDDHDTIREWKDAGAHVILHAGDHPGTFAEKVNVGYENTNAPWLFLVGDDVRFQPGWLDHAQHAARDGAHVIGTNDLHNPRVIAGEHATHLMIRRAYVDERGASWDGPKVVCHEGYRHNFVDDEMVTVAKQRGVWASAPQSKVEHLHPLWGLAEDDDTYRLGDKFLVEDRILFQRRARANREQATG